MLKLRRPAPAWGLLGWLVISAGCTTEVQFNQNAAYILNQERFSKEEFTRERRYELATVLGGMFGTPDSPSVPKLGDVEVGKVLELHKLQFAAGPVGRDVLGRGRGVFREDCAHCHGVSGDGAGPTATFLNPYPRDYRMGVFKFKSTPKGGKPTYEDLRRVVVEGIPGTAMPSFKVLPDNEIDALINYVRYLSIRGELERSLVFFATTDLDPGERLLDLSSDSAAKAKRGEQAAVLRDYAAEIVTKWLDAESQAIPVPPPDPARDLAASQRRGRELFYGAVANCIKCHGDSALGDGQTSDYDEWTKELEPTNADALAAYTSLGDFVLPPRNIIPRNLRHGVYRGGRRPVDLFWRIHNGIEGTPMPAALIKPAEAPVDQKGLTYDDIWALVDYVRSLPYESISQPPVTEPAYLRERM